MELHTGSKTASDYTNKVDKNQLVGMFMVYKLWHLICI